MTERNLVDEVKAAIDSIDTDQLVGFALCTDDELSTLYAASLTAAQLRDGSDADLLFCPTDWPDGHEVEFRGIAADLRARSSAEPNLKRHVDQAFGALVQAVAELREARRFADDAFLSVLSTDPSEYLEQLEADSVQRLNRPDIVDARMRFLQKWT